MIIALTILALVVPAITLIGMTVLGKRADKSRLQAFYERRDEPMPHTTNTALAELRSYARRRSFGVIDPDRRAAVEHGYLLALEEAERLLAEDDEVTASPRDAA